MRYNHIISWSHDHMIRSSYDHVIMRSCDYIIIWYNLKHYWTYISVTLKHTRGNAHIRPMARCSCTQQPHPVLCNHSTISIEMIIIIPHVWIAVENDIDTSRLTVIEPKASTPPFCTIICCQVMAAVVGWEWHPTVVR